MGEDLRSYVRKHQSEVGLDEIRKYAIYMFMSLHELRKNKIVHADIKPDNFLFALDDEKGAKKVIVNENGSNKAKKK